MKRSNATDNNAKEVAGITTSTKLYQLRGPAKRSKRSTPPPPPPSSTNRNSVQGTKKSSTNDSATGGHKVIDTSQQPRRSSLRLGLGSRSSVSNTRTKRTTSHDNGHTSIMPLSPSSPPPPPPSSPPLITKKSKKITKSDSNEILRTIVVVDGPPAVDNGRKVRMTKILLPRDSKKNGVGKSNKINDSHNNNDHDNNVVVVNSDGRTHDTTSSIDGGDDKTFKKSTTKLIKTKQTNNRVRTKRRYICNFCDKEFLGGNDLRKHIRIHTDERPFECQHCGQRFRQGGCLKNHIASQHGTSETFTCYYCNKTFPIKERLRLHMRLHSGEKPYKCKICFKRFARGGQVSTITYTHTHIYAMEMTFCFVEKNT